MILSFELTMPNVGSWNGQWTGSGNPYFRFRKLHKKEAIEFMEGKENKNYYYSWNDGWGANVEVKIISSRDKRKLQKITKGFWGYEWMIDSILEHDEIRN